MKLPDSIVILGIPYKIIYCDKPSEVDFHGRESLWGQIDYWTCTIRIYNKDLPEQQVVKIILHEVFHAIDQGLHLNLYGSAGDNHDKMDATVLALIDVLYRNGWIKEGE